MTSLRPIDLVCPVCDSHFRSQSVVSTNSFGGKRTDFHERAAGAQPLPYLVHTCTACGYSGVERNFVAGINVCGLAGRARSARPEQPVAGVAKSGDDVAVRVQLAINRRANDAHVGVRVA